MAYTLDQFEKGKKRKSRYSLEDYLPAGEIGRDQPETPAPSAQPQPTEISNVNPAFAAAHPTINKILATLSSPLRKVMANPWVERAGQTGATVMTGVDNPNMVSTGSKFGDITSGLWGNVMGFAANPAGSAGNVGAGLWGGAEQLAGAGISRIPQLAKLPAALQTGLKLGAASVPYEAMLAAANNRPVSTGEMATAAGSNALLGMLPAGIGKVLGGKAPKVELPTVPTRTNRGDIAEQVRGILGKRQPPAAANITRPILPIATEKFSIVPGKSRAEQLSLSIQQRLDEWNRKNLGIDKKAAQATAEIQKADTLANVAQQRDLWLAENFIPKADRQQVLKNSLQINRPLSPEEVASLSKRTQPTSPKAGSMSSDNKGMFLRPEAMPVPPKVQPVAAKPLPEGVGAMSYKLPDTEGTIVSKTDKKLPSIQEAWKRIYSKTVNNVQRMYDINKYAEKVTGGKINAKDNMFINAINVKKADMVSYAMLTKRLVDYNGKEIGKPFSSVTMQIPKGQTQAFEAYMKAKHAPSWLEQGKEVYNKDLNIDETTAAKIARDYEQKYPQFKKTADDFYKWWDDFEQAWLVDTGYVSKETMAAWREQHPFYIRLQRLMDSVETVNRGQGGGKKTFYKAKGSERPTVSFIESAIEDIDHIVKSVKKNRPVQNLIGYIEKDPEGMRGWGEVVKLPKKTGAQPHGTFDTGLDKILTETNESFTKWGIDPKYGNVVIGRVKGEPVHVKIYDPMLLEAMSNLTPQMENVVTRSSRQVMRQFKNLTTGSNPVFGIARNSFRDLLMGYVSGSTANPAKYSYDYLDALVSILANATPKEGKVASKIPAFAKSWTANRAKLAQRYENVGGGHASSISADQNLLADAKASILPGYINPKKPLQALNRGTGKALSIIEQLNNAIENTPRIAEFKRAEQAGKPWEQALYESSDVTVNFNKTGDISRFLDAFIPYFNPAVQGVDKFFRIYKDDPARAITKSFVAVTIPTVLLYAANRNNPAYKTLNDRDKDTYFLIPKPDGTFIKIPKPREVGVMFGAIPERIMRRWADSDPQAWEGFVNTLMVNFLPSARPIWQPIADLRANKDFADRPIVPGDLERLSPAMQYDERSSEPARAIGRTLNKSPKQIDYLAKSYLGIVGQVGIPLFAKDTTVAESLQRQFILDPAYSNKASQQFYDAKAELDRQYADNKQLGKSMNKEADQKRRLYSFVSNVMADTRKQMDAIQKDAKLKPETKKAKLRQYQLELARLAGVVNLPASKQIKQYNTLIDEGYIKEPKETLIEDDIFTKSEKAEELKQKKSTLNY
ncbi:MAG: LPD38 domain-containing protein [Dehalococcoidia bacterium]